MRQGKAGNARQDVLERAPCRRVPGFSAPARRPDGGSSSGRTADSDSASLGSNPSPPANFFSSKINRHGPAGPAGSWDNSATGMVRRSVGADLPGFRPTRRRRFPIVQAGALKIGNKTPKGIFGRDGGQSAASSSAVLLALPDGLVEFNNTFIKYT